MVSKDLFELDNVKFEQFEYTTMIVKTMENIIRKLPFNKFDTEKVRKLILRHQVKLRYYNNK